MITETIQSIIDWHKETFPDATLDGQIVKFEEETKEWENTSWGVYDEVEELADLFIVACGIMRFDMLTGMEYMDLVFLKPGVTNYDGRDLWEAVIKKMEKNRARTWKKTTEGTYHHV